MSGNHRICIVLASASSTISSDDEDDSHKIGTKKSEALSSKEFSPLNRNYESDKNGKNDQQYNISILYIC